MKILIASMAFVLPAIPLSALGGEIADSHDKAVVARRLKFAEIFVQAIGAAGFALSSLEPPLSGPVRARLHRGPVRADQVRHPAGSSAARRAGRRQRAGRGRDLRRHHLRPDRRAARGGERPLDRRRRDSDDGRRGRPATGRRASSRRPESARPASRFDWNVFASTWRIIEEVRARPPPVGGALATSWFWTVGIVALSLVPVIVKARIGGGLDVEIARQPDLRRRRRGRLARRGAALARADRARAGAVPARS